MIHHSRLIQQVARERQERLHQEAEVFRALRSRQKASRSCLKEEGFSPAEPQLQPY